MSETEQKQIDQNLTHTVGVNNGSDFDRLAKGIGFFADLFTMLAIISGVSYIIFNRKSERVFAFLKRIQSLVTFFLAVLILSSLISLTLPVISGLTGWIEMHITYSIESVGLPVNTPRFVRLILFLLLEAIIIGFGILLMMGYLVPAIDRRLKTTLYNEFSELAERSQEDLRILSLLSLVTTWASMAQEADKASNIDGFINDTVRHSLECVFGDKESLYKASLMLFNKETKILEISHSRGLSEGTKREFSLRPSEGVGGTAFEEKREQLVEDVSKSSLYKNDPNGKNRGSILCIPLLVVDPSSSIKEVLGVYSITCLEPNTIKREHIERFMPFADLMVIMLKSYLRLRTNEKADPK